MVMTAGAETILIEEETVSVETIVHTIAVEAVMKVQGSTIVVVEADMIVVVEEEEEEAVMVVEEAELDTQAHGLTWHTQ